ncbi:hypothetical protein PRIPAC_90724 [Pristionchus pacificus]|uniref:Uncharacterized protein n=1 Tax=Pristionchus pacificus TaxID=54126 RepID=A0A2A6CVG9_PRIPA|nr:hypothetical protein PRIPAC_90724 [Pristionchus pacificus]|eukprot:PDM82047.1 hypothetical protein PRIPAC_36440 [Pristionchus pacificus]
MALKDQQFQATIEDQSLRIQQLQWNRRSHSSKEMIEKLIFTQQKHFEMQVIDLYQDGIGLLYYLKRGRPQKLYSIADDGYEAVAYSPAEIVSVSRIDDGIYIQTEENKIYRVDYQPPHAIRTKYFRRQIREAEGERRERGSMVSQIKDGKKYIYRICDDPEKGIEIDATDEQLEGLMMKGVHRGKIIFERTENEMQDAQSIERLTENIIVIGSAFPGNDFGFLDDSSPLIFNMLRPTLEVFNTETMEAWTLGTDLPNARYRVVGVHGGKITVQAGSIVFTADLPERFQMIEVLNFKECQMHAEFQMNVVNLYQDGKGTPYYLKRGRPQKLYALADDGTEAAAYAPDEIDFAFRIDEGIYMQTEGRKIYRVDFQPPSGIVTNYLRQIGEVEDESAERGSMVSQIKDGKKYVYRICDDPEKGVLIDATEEQLEGLMMKGVHRGKIIFERMEKQDAQSIEKLTDNIIVIGSAFPGYDFGFLDDSSPLIFSMLRPTLEVFNTETMEAWAVVTDLPNAYYRVVGVHGGKITVQAGGIVFAADSPERFL